MDPEPPNSSQTHATGRPPPRYLGRRHLLAQVGDQIQLRDRVRPDDQPLATFPAAPAGWKAAIAELRRRDGAVLDASTGTRLEASAGGRWRVLAGAGVGAALLAVGLWFVLGGSTDAPPAGGPAAEALLTDDQVVTRAREATMLIVVYDGEPIAVGSGWMYDLRRGLIVTNAHVVDEGTSFRAGLPGTLAVAALVAQAPCEDLAVLRVTAVSRFEALELAPDEATGLGDRVAALGYPPRLPSIPEATQVRWTFGSVSYLPDRESGELIEHSARLDAGNSGGPLVDMRGRLVGVNVGTRVDDPALGYAIPVARVRSLIEEMIAGGDVCAA